MRCPSGENATDLTQSLWPFKGPTTSSPVSASHTRIVLSSGARNDAASIWRERDGPDPVAVAFQRSHHLLTRLGIPHSDRLVVGARNDAVSIWRERDGPDRVTVAFQRSYHLLTRLGIPHSDRLVVGARNDAASIWRERDGPDQLLWPFKGPTTSSPVSASHTRIVLSSEPETMRRPSGENATDLTQSLWPFKGPTTSSPVSASHTRIVLSWSQKRCGVHLARTRRT